MINHNETPNKTVDKITSDLKKYKNVAVDEAKQTRLLIRILISSAKEYLKNKDFKLDNEDKEFIKNQSSDILKLMTQGDTYVEIAHKCQMSLPNLNHQIRNICVKMDVDSKRKLMSLIQEFK